MSTKRKKKSRHNWTDAEKEQLIMAFEGTPVEGRGQWLESQGLKGNSWFYVMRKKYLATHPELSFTEPAQPTVALQRIPPAASPAAILAEYDRLGGKGEKLPWLKAHGLTYSSIYDLRKRVNGHLNGHHPTVREALSKPIPTIEATFTPTTTLDDAILALEVKRDHYTEIIANLKAMRGSR